MSSKNNESDKSLIAEHYNKLEEKGIEARKESRIYTMRNFNNWIKSMVIAEFIDRIKSESKNSSSLKLLDIGSGKGGDLRKYKIGRVSHVVCADIAEVSVQQSRERYEEMKKFEKQNNRPGSSGLFTAEFITADCTRELLQSKYSDTKIEFDLVCCQFAFHYCFESLPQVRCMLRNISDNLRTGGYFIGTMPDCFDIVNRMEMNYEDNNEQQQEEMKFGNDIYHIKFNSDKIKLIKHSDQKSTTDHLNHDDNDDDDDDQQPHQDQSRKFDIPLFGAEYIFHLDEVVDCPEYIVYFPLLIQLASEFNLKLIWKKKFSTYFHEKQKDKLNQQLLRRMSALQTFSFADCGKKPDYPHAEDYIDELIETGSVHNKSSISIGTISESEWEAISLYVVFAFVKV